MPASHFTKRWDRNMLTTLCPFSNTKDTKKSRFENRIGHQVFFGLQFPEAKLKLNKEASGSYCFAMHNILSEHFTDVVKTNYCAMVVR